jgi:formylglycine-generating enzyme required for sulfatase activity
MKERSAMTGIWGILRKRARIEKKGKPPHTEGTWTDTEIDDVTQDRFDFQDHARMLAERAVKTGPPLTIGVFGPWGSGKSSLMELIKDRLPQETQDGGRVQSIWINAWQLGSQDEVGHAFLQALFSRVQSELPLRRRIDWGKLGRQLASNLYRVVLAITPMVVGVLIAKPEAGWKDVSSLLQSPIAGTGTLVTVGLSLWVWVKPIVESARKVVSFDLQAALKYAPYEAQVSELIKLRKRFAGMVQTLVGEDGRLVVFIDDLDRCMPDKAPEVLEAIKLFTAVDGCAYVLGLDPEIIRQGLEKRYKFEAKAESLEYLEKIVQIAFHLPPLEYNQVVVFIKREYPDVERVCSIAPEIFARGVEPNPRKIKRALNIYRMLHHLADTRWKNYEMDHRVDPELLAKIAVVQSCFPDLYEVLVRDPMSIKTLEEWARVSDDREWFSKTSQVQPIHVAFLTWLKNRIRDPEMAKKVREGSMKLEQLESGAFDIDPSLIRALNTGSPRSKDLELPELGAYIYLTNTDERLAGQLYPSREEREVLLGGDEKAIKELLEKIQKRPPQWEDRHREEEVYTQFLKGVVENLERGTSAQRWSANVALDLLSIVRRERKDFEPPTVRIPSGVFWMGSGEELAMAHWYGGEGEFAVDILKEVLEKELYPDECPQHQVYLLEYRIGRFPVTNQEYQAFIDATRHPPPRHWKRGHFRKGKENHPVVWVGYDDAVAYCDWLTKETKRRYRLPTEAEWEKAARGTDRRIYPWGNEWDPSRLNSEEGGKASSSRGPASTARRLRDTVQSVLGAVSEGRTTRVGQFSPSGDSPYGVADMAGNVWEWCEDWYDAEAYKDRKGKDVSDPLVTKESEFRVQRGGSFRDSKDNARCAFRRGGEVNSLARLYEQVAFKGGLGIACDHWGFRVVISQKEEIYRWFNDKSEAEGSAAGTDTTTEKTE